MTKKQASQRTAFESIFGHEPDPSSDWSKQRVHSKLYDEAHSFKLHLIHVMNGGFESTEKQFYHFHEFQEASNAAKNCGYSVQSIGGILGVQGVFGGDNSPGVRAFNTLVG